MLLAGQITSPHCWSTWWAKALGHENQLSEKLPFQLSHLGYLSNMLLSNKEIKADQAVDLNARKKIKYGKRASTLVSNR
jgi:hypothetical protein